MRFTEKKEVRMEMENVGLYLSICILTFPLIGCIAWLMCKGEELWNKLFH